MDEFFRGSNGEYKFDPGLVKPAAEHCLAKCEMFMRNDKSRIVVANTFTIAQNLDPYYELADKYDYTTFCMIVENRHGGKNTHECDEDIINRMKTRFDIKL